jgi:hypothetical protein
MFRRGLCCSWTSLGVRLEIENPHVDIAQEDDGSETAGAVNERHWYAGRAQDSAHGDYGLCRRDRSGTKTGSARPHDAYFAQQPCSTGSISRNVVHIERATDASG